MKVRFGVSVISGTAFPHRQDLNKFAELIRIIDGSGVELIGTNDTSFINGDAYVRATLIAQTARNAQVGIHPTNPLTREPQIMAAFLASIDAMTEGRAFLDIGSGDSAVYNIGLAPAIREDVIADDQPAGARADAWRSRVRELRQLSLGGSHGFRKTLHRRRAMFGEKRHYFFDFRNRPAGVADAGRHFCCARAFS